MLSETFLLSDVLLQTPRRTTRVPVAVVARYAVASLQSDWSISGYCSSAHGSKAAKYSLHFGSGQQEACLQGGQRTWFNRVQP